MPLQVATASIMQAILIPLEAGKRLSPLETV
jgi:hypothetical protein